MWPLHEFLGPKWPILNGLAKKLKEVTYNQIYKFVTKKLKPILVQQQKKAPIYAIGSSDPITFHSFSGIDIKVTLDDQRIGTAQALCWDVDMANDSPVYQGEMMLVEFISKDISPGQFLNQTGRLKATGATEYGHVEEIFNQVVKFIKYSSGTAVDDLIVEGKYLFTSVSEKKNNGE